MITNTIPRQQRRQPAPNPSIPPSPPASPPSHPSYNVTGTHLGHHGRPKAKYSLNAHQRNQVNAGTARTQQKKKMPQNWYSLPSWRQNNPNLGQDVHQQLQRDVHTAFVIEQQKEAQKWVVAAKRLANVLDLANSPVSVLPRLQPRNPAAPRIHVLPAAPRRVICPSGHRYLESTGYIRSVPIFRPPPDVRRVVPDRASDRDVGYLYAYHVSRSNEETRQAAMEKAAFDVNMLEWREGVRSLPADDRKEGRPEPMDIDQSEGLLEEPSVGEEAGLKDSPSSSPERSGHTKRKADDYLSASIHSATSSKRSRSDATG